MRRLHFPSPAHPLLWCLPALCLATQLGLAQSGTQSPSRVAPLPLGVCDGGPFCPGGCTTLLESYSQTINPSRPGTTLGSLGTEFPNPFPKFDSTKGTLKSVQIVITATPWDRKYQFENQAAASCAPQVPVNCPVRLSARLTVLPEHPGATLIDFTSDFGLRFTTWPGQSIPAFDGGIDFGGICPLGAGIDDDIVTPGACNVATVADAADHLVASGYTICFPNGPEVTQTVCVTDAVGLGFYQSPGGAGNFNFDLASGDTSFILDNLMGCPGVIHGRLFKIKLRADVNYWYCPANQPPITNPDQTLVCPNAGSSCPSYVDIPVLANDCDPTQDCPAVFGRLDCGSLAICSQPVHGTISIVGCGSASSGTGCPQTNNCPGCVVRYTPAIGYTGTDSFCYKVSDTGDGMGGPVLSSAPTPVSIRVCPPPNAIDDSFSTMVGRAVTLNVLCNDTGAPAVGSSANNTTCVGCTGTVVGALPFPACAATTIVCSSAQLVSGPAHGSVQAAASCAGTSGGCSAGSNCFVYTPAPGYCGADSFTYKVTDSAGCCDTATVSLTIYAPPLANPDSYATCEEASCESDNCVTMNVLANDVPGGGTGCPLGTGSAIDCGSIEITQYPAGGQLTLGQPCGSPCAGACIRYCPNLGFRGADSFKYRVSDSRVNTNACQSNVFPGVSNEATVTILVRCAPDAIDDKFVDDDPLDLAPLVIDVLANDQAFRLRDVNEPCAGLTLDQNSLVIVDGGTSCSPPTKGSVTVITDIDGRRKVLYTPSVPLGPTGHDQFSYLVRNSAGCCDTACCEINAPPPCDERRRDLCGSLLLFPELDNRTGRVTLLTLTDGCCGAPAQNTLVETVFIRKETCTESNSTFTLSPCDSLTLLGSSLVAPNAQGYLYVFAKNNHATAANPNGTPIVFNHLIGQSLILDGTLASEYCVNAVSFRGLGAEGAENDDDGDGIRDLNGPTLGLPEYEEAPREIHFPRFLGQDGAATPVFASEVILVALSGGGAFQTRVRISGYNDNEQPFGSTWTFRCWDRVALRELAIGTLDANLEVNGDGDEIVGWPLPRRNAGWLVIDGDEAFSDAEVIHDPAIYALLVEREGAWKAATLPFEICSQVNGDLLPQSVLGDGPAPVNGDDQ